MVASGTIQMLGLVTGVLLARGLGPHARGEFAAITLWAILVVSIGSLGLSDALTYEIASGRDHAKRAIGTAIRTWAMFSPTLMIVGAGILTLTLKGYDATTRTNGYLMLLAIPTYFAAILVTGALQGLRAFGAFNVVRTLLPTVTAALLIILVALHQLTVRTAVISYIATYVVVAGAGIILLHRMSFLSITFERETLRRMLAYGIRSQSTFVASTLIERLDQLLISLFLGATSLGLYAVGFTLTSATTMAAYTLGLVAFPQLAALPEGPERAFKTKRFVLLGAAGCIIIAIPVLALTPQLLSLFFGAAFVRVADVSRVLLLATIFSACTQLFAALLRGLGRPLDAGFAAGVGLVVSVVLLVVLLPTLGLMGAAIASLIAYTLIASWMLRKICAVFGLSLAQFIRTAHGAATP